MTTPKQAENERMSVMPTRMTRRMRRQIDKVAKDHGCTPSDAVRMLVGWGLLYHDAQKGAEHGGG